MNRSMKSWLYKSNQNETKCQLRPGQVIVITAEVYNNSIGLECPFFTVTYGFLGSVSNDFKTKNTKYIKLFIVF